MHTEMWCLNLSPGWIARSGCCFQPWTLESTQQGKWWEVVVASRCSSGSYRSRPCPQRGSGTVKRQPRGRLSPTVAAQFVVTAPATFRGRTWCLAKLEVNVRWCPDVPLGLTIVHRSCRCLEVQQFPRRPTRWFDLEQSKWNQRPLKPHQNWLWWHTCPHWVAWLRHLYSPEP